jgi:hypothetical protein
MNECFAYAPMGIFTSGLWTQASAVASFLTIEIVTARGIYEQSDYYAEIL